MSDEIVHAGEIFDGPEIFPTGYKFADRELLYAARRKKLPRRGYVRQCDIKPARNSSAYIIGRVRLLRGSLSETIRAIALLRPYAEVVQDENGPFSPDDVYASYFVLSTLSRVDIGVTPEAFAIAAGKAAAAARENIKTMQLPTESEYLKELEVDIPH